MRRRTKEDVLEEFRRADLRPLWVGRAAYLWSEGEPDRAKALKELKADLVREDMVIRGRAARPVYYDLLGRAPTRLG